MSTSQFTALEKTFLWLSEQTDPRCFQGHQSSLGHYYRHLYQIVSFVHHEGPVGEKSQYVKSIRAQLSNYEQALLLINSLTGVGWDWWNNGYIELYGLVKNLPRGFVETYCRLDVQALFVGNYFEWQQSSGKPAILAKVRETQDKILVEVSVSKSKASKEENLISGASSSGII